ncbi:MgtC/SapB family protein [Olivibacter ginsenosidimutans]|uniref:MgtC/SapB family protein n=1 Tax=Olivibacter ginsenosidimutans TaxID=1176537 RepID=A0ABP9BXZ8_9SPHI
MQQEFLNYPVGPMALKLTVALGMGMLIGMERKWSHKEAGIRTFSIVALLGMFAAVISPSVIIAAMVGVFLLIIVTNARSLKTDNTVEITTSAALIADYLLGVLVGLGHIFTPVAGTIIVTMLLAWKTELNRFAGGLQPSEIRSAIILGLIGFVIYPIMPDRFIDPWQLFNPSDAWISIIAIAGIGFVNYVFLRIYRSHGLYLGAIFGGLVNSTATVAEISSRLEDAGTPEKITTLSSLINISMFVRNMVLAALFVPLSLAATLFPLVAMAAIAALWIWRDYIRHKDVQQEIDLKLSSPISLRKVLWFGILFIVIQTSGTLLTRVFGSLGIMVTGLIGGFISSASTTAAAATMAEHGEITATVAGSVAIISSMASALIDLPIVWRTISNKKVVKEFTLKLLSILLVGITAVVLDRVFHVSDLLL